MEIIVELIFEFVLVFLFEGIFEAGLQKVLNGREADDGTDVGGSSKKPFHAGPVLSTIGYVSMGGLLGWVSLLIKPEHMLADPMSSYINLALSPIAAGACMMAIGSWRKKHGQALLRIDKFFYGYIFALTFSLVRFLFAYDGML